MTHRELAVCLWNVMWAYKHRKHTSLQVRAQAYEVLAHAEALVDSGDHLIIDLREERVRG